MPSPLASLLLLLFGITAAIYGLVVENPGQKNLTEVFLLILVSCSNLALTVPLSALESHSYCSLGWD